MSVDSEDEQEMRLERALGRYKSTKGAADKRKETSKINMAKARAAKLSGLKQKKHEEENEYEVENSEESEEEENSSEDEDLIITKKKPQKGKGRAGAPAAAAPSDSRMDRMEALLLKMATQGKKKAKKPVRKTVIQVAPAAASAPVTNPKVEQLKNNILRF